MNEISRPETFLPELRPLPANPQIERALLGTIMLRNSAYDVAAGIVTDQDFADPLCALVWKEIAKTIERGGNATPVTLWQPLENPLRDHGGAKDLLASLCASTPTSINVRDYAEQIRANSIRRAVIDLSSESADRAFATESGEDPARLVESMAGALDAIGAGPSGGQEMEISNSIGATLKQWEAADTQPVAMIQTGLAAVDEIIGGLCAGDLAMIAGNTGMGKTALSTVISYTQAKRGKRVGILSLEMPLDQLDGRMITGLTGVPGPRHRKTPLTSNQWGQVFEAQQELADLRIIRRYAPGISLAGIKSICRRWKRRGGLDALFIDYLQIMSTDGHRNENRTQEIGRLTMGLKTMAGELGIPVVCLSQLSRANYHRENPRPLLSDLRDSGSIEQDADFVLFTFREEYFHQQNRPERKPGEEASKFSARLHDHEERLARCKGVAEVIVAKNRHGAGGIATLTFNASRAWFCDRHAVN